MNMRWPTRSALSAWCASAQRVGIVPSRIGVMGFSAGGELAALASMRFDGGNKDAADMIDRENSRPDFQALIYPGSSGRIVPTKDSPPSFLPADTKTGLIFPAGWPRSI